MSKEEEFREVVRVAVGEKALKVKLRDASLLLVTYLILMFGGAALFQSLNYSESYDLQRTDKPVWKEIKDQITILGQNYKSSPEEIEWFGDHCPEKVKEFTTTGGISSSDFYSIEESCPDLTDEEYVYTYEDDFYPTYIESLYYCMTITSTIGYGHILPPNALAKVLFILYVFVSLPITFAMLSAIADIIGAALSGVYNKLAKRRQHSLPLLVGVTCLLLVIGLILFILIPSLVFYNMEEEHFGWSYLACVYYAVVSISTIGFGDFVAAQGDNGAYQLFVIVWVMASLGYIFTLVNFVTRALRLRRLNSFFDEKR